MQDGVLVEDVRPIKPSSQIARTVRDICSDRGLDPIDRFASNMK